MKRTTIVLPDHLHEQLRAEAFRKRVSMASLVRQKLEARHTPAQKVNSIDPLLAAAGIGSDGALTQGIDDDLYGDD
jgi:hypothetical protein